LSIKLQATGISILENGASDLRPGFLIADKAIRFGAKLCFGPDFATTQQSASLAAWFKRALTI